jgi:hypothetical protein
VIALELRELQQTLNQKADAVQLAFVAVSEQLYQVGRRLIEARGEGEGPILAEQDLLRAKQERLAAEVNAWREQARLAVRQPDEAALRPFLADLMVVNDVAVRAAAEGVLYLLDHPEEAATGRRRARPQTASVASRLIERARTEFDLRGVEPDPRQRAAVEFANRPGVAQNDAALAEVEAALEDADPVVREVAVLTAIQMHRFRAMRLGDLEAAHVSVEWLARVKHRAVVPVLIEIVSTPRTGYLPSQGELSEADNLGSRLAALVGLVAWRTPQAQAAVRARQHDRDPQMMEAATRALEAFPGEWRA